MIDIHWKQGLWWVVCLGSLVMGAQAHGQGVIATGPPGQYQFTFSTNAATKITSGPGWLKIEWSSDTTPSNPVPVPPDPGTVNPIPSNPNPPPVAKPITLPTQPIKGPIFLIATYAGPDTVKRLPTSQQDLLADRTIAAALKPSQTYWRVYAVSDPVLNGWRSDAVAAGDPGLMAIGEGGKLVASGSLPASKQAVLDLARKLRGG